jgi:hypothetical protein
MRARSARLVPLVLLLVCLVHASARAGDDAAPPFLDQFPGDTLVYISLDDIPAARERAEGTALGQVRRHPEVAAFIERPKERLAEYRRSVERELPPAIRFDDLAACFSQRAAVGLIADLPNERAAVLLIGEAPGAEAPAALVKAFPEAVRILFPSDGVRAEATGEGTATARIGGTTLRVRADGPRLHVAVATNGTDPDALPGMDGPRLADNASFMETIGRLGTRRDITIVMNQPTVLREMAESAAPATGDAPVPTTKAAALHASGLLGVTSIGVSSVAEGAGYRTRAFVHTPDGPEGLLGIASDEPVSAAFLEAIPKTAVAFAAKRIRSDRIVPAVRAITDAMNMPEEMWDEQLGRIEAQTGVHPLNGLVEPLGDEMALVMIDPLEAGGTPLFHLNGLALVARLDDPETFAASLRHFAGMGGFLAQAVPFGGGPLAEEHEGVPITGLRVPSNTYAPCFAVTEGILVVGTTPRPVRMILDTIAGRSPSVLEREGIGSALATVGGREHAGVSWAAAREGRPNMELLSFQAAQGAVLAGMLLPGLGRARGLSSQASSGNNLKQIGLGLTMYLNDKNRMPETLADLYEGGRGIVSDPMVFRDPATGTGYRYISGVPGRAHPGSIVVFSEPVRMRGIDMRLALFMDGHFERLPEAEFQARLERTLADLREMGAEPVILEPWLPAGIEPPASGGEDWWRASPLNPYRGEAEPLVAFANDLVETLPLYRLPPIALLVPKDAPATASVFDRTAEGYVFDSYGPLPFRCAVAAGFRMPVAGLQFGSGIALPLFWVVEIDGKQSQ